MAYAKLFPKLMDSKLWEESPETIKVFITMILMSDKQGFVNDKLPIITRKSLIPIEVCQKSLDILSSPDINSTSKEQEGRRIIPTENGWQIVNYEKYRKMGEEEEPKAKTYIDNIHKYNTEHQTTNDVSVIYPEFGESSWIFALEIWKNAGIWRNEKGEKETFFGSKREFDKKINKDNWKEFIQKLDWAVTNVQRGDVNRKYLGLLLTFIRENKWKDIEKPNELIQTQIKQVVRWDQ